MANKAGKSYALTALTPIPPLKTPLVRLVFEGIRLGLDPQDSANLKALEFIHFARWVLIPRRAWPWFGGPDPAEHLEHDYMLFESNFNGNWQNYIGAFSELVHVGMEGIWGTSVGFPGPRPITPFLDYIRGVQYLTTYYYSAYPHATTKDILGAMRVQDELEAFMLANDGLSDDEFAAAYNEFLGRIQQHLGRIGAHE